MSNEEYERKLQDLINRKVWGSDFFALRAAEFIRDHPDGSRLRPEFVRFLEALAELPKN